MRTFEFVLVHDTTLSTRATFSDSAYDAVKADPPSGCQPVNFEPYFGLQCVRQGESKLQAISDVVREVRQRFGFTLNDLGREKLYEWLGDGLDGSDLDLVAQLASMAVHRAALIGLPADELVNFMRAVNPASDDR